VADGGVFLNRLNRIHQLKVPPLLLKQLFTNRLHPLINLISLLLTLVLLPSKLPLLRPPLPIQSLLILDYFSFLRQHFPLSVTDPADILILQLQLF